jgi:hypothetical protein
MDDTGTQGQAANVNDDHARFSVESFNRLARALGVCWPDWYRKLVLSLISHPSDDSSWLDGGFLFASPASPFLYTNQYQSGALWINDRGTTERVPWPHGFVIVGATGSGKVLIDTESEGWFFIRLIEKARASAPSLTAATSPARLRVWLAASKSGSRGQRCAARWNEG